MTMSYQDALFQLGQITRAMNALGQDYSGVLKSWDSQKGTFDGYVPGLFKLQSEQDRRASAGLDDAGNLLPGFSKVGYAPDQFTMGYSTSKSLPQSGGSLVAPKSLPQSGGTTFDSVSQSGYGGLSMSDVLKSYGYGQ